jgi:hypothetical protein
MSGECVWLDTVSHTPKKIYRLKEDQAFSLSLELGPKEEDVWHPFEDFT